MQANHINNHPQDWGAFQATLPKSDSYHTFCFPHFQTLSRSHNRLPSHLLYNYTRRSNTVNEHAAKSCFSRPSEVSFLGDLWSFWCFIVRNMFETWELCHVLHPKRVSLRKGVKPMPHSPDTSGAWDRLETQAHHLGPPSPNFIPALLCIGSA